MTNAQIIIKEAIAKEVYTPEQVEMFLQKLGCVPLHTFKKWNDLGYKVKKGEHARVVTFLWKPNVKKEDGEEKETTDTRKSFYNKAVVIEDRGSKTLYSYNTPVCRINRRGRVQRLWSGESVTTMRHINAEGSREIGGFLLLIFPLFCGRIEMKTKL